MIWTICNNFHVIIFTGDNSQCKLWSSHCLSSLQTTVSFLCPSKGRFQHPEDCERYLKCISADHLACDCRCRDGTVFDSTAHRCVVPGSGLVCGTSFQTVDSSSSTFENDENDLEAAMLRIHRTINPMQITATPPTIDIKLDPVQNQQNMYVYRTILDKGSSVIAKQVSTPLEFVVEDTSAIPAWAISFGVLLIVIVLIVIVLLLY